MSCNLAPVPPITPDEITDAVISFHQLLLEKYLYLPRDKELLEAARMTPVLIRLSLDLYSILQMNRDSFSKYHDQNPHITRDHDINGYFPDYETDFYLHRSDMSIYIEEHELWLDFGNRDGTQGEEVTRYSHRFDEYLPIVERVKDGYEALIQKIKPDSPKYKMTFTSDEENKWAFQYVQCCRDMELVAMQLVDGLQLHFTDAVTFRNSRLGREILNERGSILLERKLTELEAIQAEELSLTHGWNQNT